MAKCAYCGEQFDIGTEKGKEQMRQHIWLHSLKETHPDLYEIAKAKGKIRDR